MNPQRYSTQPAQRNEQDYRTERIDWPRWQTQTADAKASAEDAARAVMHPESYDPEWRYYHGAWGG